MNEIILSSSVMPILCGCDHLVAAEPFYHADRTADFHVMIYVTKGVIYVTEDDTDYEVKAGELLFLKSGVRHYGKQLIPRGTKWYFAHFTCPQTELPAFQPDSTPIPQYTKLENTLALPKHLTDLAGTSTERDIEELIRHFNSDDPLRCWSLNAELFSLLSLIALSEMDKAAEPSFAETVAIYLSEHMREPFSGKRISQEFYLSYKHIAMLFKFKKGMTMQQYHTKLRMNEACRLLRSTLLPVGEIASQLGYQDMLYFSRCFRSYNGCSPTAYRKRPHIY